MEKQNEVSRAALEIISVLALIASVMPDEPVKILERSEHGEIENKALGD